MIEKTTAIVLRYASFSNTSRVVTWLTSSAGKVATVIKGALRPKSPFLGQYDLFYTCELLYYTREHNGLHIARECCPLKLRPRLREDWQAAATASYFCDLISRVSPPDAPHYGLFPLLEDALDFLHDSGTAPAVVFWFELRLLEHLGLAPRLRHCLDCGRALAPAGSVPARFSHTRGGILCGGCARATREASTPVHPDRLAMLTAWQRTPNPRLPKGTRTTSRQLEEIEQLLGLFLIHHLDTELPSRPICLEILRLKPGQSARSPDP